MKWSPCWQWEKGEIPDVICDYIVNSCVYEEKYIKGTVHDKGTFLALPEVRNVDIQFSNINWINALLIGYIRYANSQNFHYDLSEDDKEVAQVSKYSEGEYYKEHMDFGNNHNITRKLSLTVQLSDEDDYEGGDLIFNNSSNESVKASRGKGSIIVFDSRIAHEVTTVTSGTRYSLVKWYHGDEPLK